MSLEQGAVESFLDCVGKADINKIISNKTFGPDLLSKFWIIGMGIRVGNSLPYLVLTRVCILWFGGQYMGFIFPPSHGFVGGTIG